MNLHVYIVSTTQTFSNRLVIKVLNESSRGILHSAEMMVEDTTRVTGRDVYLPLDLIHIYCKL